MRNEAPLLLTSRFALRARWLQVPDDLEIEAGHARHATRQRKEAHLLDLEIAQDLGADAVIAKLHLRRRRVGTLRLNALEQLRTAFLPVQEHDDAAVRGSDRRERVV